MKPQAIFYTSHTGYTLRYALMLADAWDLHVYDMKKDAKKLPAGTPVFYLGWLMAGSLKGYKKAARRFSVAGAAAVGMGKSDEQTQGVRTRHKIPGNISLFGLRGGYDSRKITGFYRSMMNTLEKFLSKKIEKDPDVQYIQTHIGIGYRMLKAE